MATSKQRSDGQLIDQDGETLLRTKLPRHWVLREYRPAYGLDFALEVFKPIEPPGGNGPRLYGTLGEHIFIQLKRSIRA